MKSLQGHLLVASPHLPDPNFYRTVVLMVQHHEQGALGLVLNRPSQSSIREVLAQATDVECQTDELVGVGGPIAGPLMAVHGLRACSESEIFSGVYFATQRDHLLQIVQQQLPPYRIFSGYAGWGGGQLESELEVGGWLTMPGTIEYVFHTALDELWKTVAHDIGTEILGSSLKIKGVPKDPSMN
jgi:putative transcriptional regulator